MIVGMSSSTDTAAPFGFTFGASHTQTDWSDFRRLTWPQLVEILTSHVPGPKEGACIVPAQFRNKSRKKEEADRIDVAFLDSDSGLTLAEIEEALKAKGWEAVVSSTHSHMSTRTRVAKSNWDRFFAEHPSATAEDFLLDDKGYRPEVAANAVATDTDESYVYIDHQPCPKFRIVIPLLQPWLAGNYEDQATANAIWKERIEALAAALNLPYDQSCTDTSRLFYLPRKPANGVVPETAVIAGAHCDIFALHAPDNNPNLFNQRRQSEPIESEFIDPISGEIVDLAAWTKDYGSRFLIAKALKARKPGVLTGLVTDSKVHIDCPNSSAHTDPARDGATYVMNAGASSTKGFVIHCRHSHCTGKDRIFFVRKMLEGGWLNCDDLTDSQFQTKAPEPTKQPTDKDGGRILPVEYFCDVAPVTEAQDFVEDLLIQGTMSVIYGESNSGKTFFATDLAFHIASGREWNGRQVDQGVVLYCALEGGHGIRNRIAALKAHYGVTDLPFAIVPVAVNMLDPDQDIETVIRTIKHVADKFSMPVKYTVMDTLSRALSGGNENAPDDMGALVMNGTRIQQVTGSHLSWVHHSGKDQAKGARGHSLLRAATETEIEVIAEDGARSAKVQKQRDLECSGEFHFELKVVELGTNHRGKPVTSCVVEYVEPPTGQIIGQKRTRMDRLPDGASIVLRALGIALSKAGAKLPPGSDYPYDTSAVSISTWREEFYQLKSGEQQAKIKAFSRGEDTLLTRKLITERNGLVWLTKSSD